LYYNIIRNISICFGPQGTIIRESQHSTALTFVKYVGWLQDAVYQDPSYLYNCSENKCVLYNHLTILHHVSYIQKWLILFYAVVCRFYSLLMVRCGSKHVGILNMIL
jgi:hypothetical protein